jgi:hypothetical protein
VFPLLPLEVQSKLSGGSLFGPLGEVVANVAAPNVAKRAVETA